MPPKKDNNNPQINNNNNSNNNNNINNELLTAVSTAPTVTITVSSTSNSNHNSNNSNNNNNNNSNTNNNSIGSNATVITSLTPRAAAALAICSSSNNNINNNNNNNISAGLTDNGGQSLYVNDVAAEQRTIAYQANAKLCRLVRKCPWMYDRNHHNYAKKHILDKSWTKIAKECNDSVASCKERWRNIRAAFARSINIYKTHSGPNRVKPYYLHKELTFLVKPMMEGRDKKDDFEDDTRPDVETNGEVDGTEEEDEDEDVEHEEEEEEEFQDETAEIKSAFEALNPAITIHTEEYHQRNPTKTMQQDKIRNINNNNNNINGVGGHNYEYNSLYDLPSASDAEAEFNYCNDNDRREKQMRCGGGGGVGVVSSKRLMYSAADTMDTKRLKLNSNSLDIQEADVRFLEAVLPDMALMNTRQKIIFKRKLYQTLEEVLENSANFPLNQTPTIPNEIHTSNSNNYNNTNHTVTGNNNNSNNTAASTTTTITTTGGTQVRQTVLTVNSQTARTLINNIATLNEAELQKVCGFLQTSVRPHHTVTARLTNGTQIAPSSAAAHLMHSTPKITITKVTCPPPPALRNLSSNSSATLTCNTSPIINSSGVMSSNVHSTTRGTNYHTTTTTSKEPIITNSTNNNNNNNITNKNNNNNNIQNSTWNSLVPITIKDEVEDVDID